MRREPDRDPLDREGPDRNRGDRDRPDRWSLLGALHMKAGYLAINLASLRRPRLSLGARLVALDDHGGVFLVRHSYLPGLHLPGGAVDPGETCAAAAEREAREEGALRLSRPPELYHIYWNKVGGRHDHVALFVARGAVQAGRKPPSLEIIAAGFHPLDRLPDDLTPATRARIAEIADGQPRSDIW